MEDSVHELAITGENPPTKYIYTDSINPSQDPSIPLPLLEIPVIDFNRLTTPSDGTKPELERLRSALSSSLDDDDSAFLNAVREGGSISARFNFYPPCPTPDRALGLKPHSDGTVITYLLQDGEVEGLQVLKDEQWFRVPIVPDALVLHVGDHLEVILIK
ncbi:unnamed protein product [Linum tenue]|uniref:Fe2OG dioxygenase domain-containing protein n=1 Tax=Linum tenue TaxID=586396 RepID=A0AAV0HUI4_9ROSI|nr:unnamed protein product [Linum tenue]